LNERLAIITDIHGNYNGLLAVLADIAQAGCGKIVCLGDLVEGGTGDLEVVQAIRERGIPCVRGNHDEGNDLALPWDVQQFLWSLPYTRTDGDLFFTHISPRSKQNPIDDPYEAWNVFDECDSRLIFVGHTHIAQLFGERSDHFAETATHAVPRNQPIPLDITDRYIVCVGAIGYSREMVLKPQYCIYDAARQTIEFRTVDGPLEDPRGSYLLAT
jgi:predicted phosphodiesterase